MNPKTFKWMAAGLIGLVMVQGFSSIRPTKAQPVTPIDPSVEEYILNRTIQIRLFAPLQTAENESGVPDNGNKSYVMAQGLGTLVRWQGERAIVTHNHWGEMLQAAEYVTIHDAHGKRLLKLALNELTSLVRYSDPGTLVLEVPAGLPEEAADLSEAALLVSGDILNVVRQDPHYPDQLIVTQARMLRIKEYKGQPVYKLAILDGTEIIPGDSGGGNWYAGKLVGNTWASYIDTLKLPNSPETCLVAPLPLNYLQAVDLNPKETYPQVAALYE